ESGGEKGVGGVGRVKNEMRVKELALFVKEKVEVNGVRMVGHGDRMVKKVGVVGGDGKKYIDDGKGKGGDV
ncbi:Nif3-like dinuclear metal center hexameric protein, partial [Bacillus subtilis]|uniref:Nif3-like dinuclear metal center hexameric protein n=1 Tax=Bacillus subtilis TaxID=1423 RepID=UPI003F4D3F6E